MIATSAVGTNDLVVGSCHLHNPHKTHTTTNPSFEMDRAYGTIIEVARSHLTPGLKSGAIKSVMPDGIFYVNIENELE